MPNDPAAASAASALPGVMGPSAGAGAAMAIDAGRARKVMTVKIVWVCMVAVRSSESIGGSAMMRCFRVEVRSWIDAVVYVCHLKRII